MGSKCSVLCPDSATQFEEVHRGHVVTCGFHGAVYCGYLAARVRLCAVILNDAGGGLEDAGRGCLAPATSSAWRPPSAATRLLE